jgi:hypothetical protein
LVGYEAIDASTLDFELLVRPALKKLFGDIESGRVARQRLPDRGISDDSVCGIDIDTAQRADDSMDGLNFFSQFVDSDRQPAKDEIVSDVHDAACKLDVNRGDWLSGDLDRETETTEAWLSRVACASAKPKETSVQRDAGARLK